MVAQSSKHRSYSFVDLETIIKAGLSVLKWNIGAPSRAKSDPWNPYGLIESLLRHLETGKRVTRPKARFEGQASRLADLPETSAGYCNSVRGVAEEGEKRVSMGV